MPIRPQIFCYLVLLALCSASIATAEARQKVLQEAANILEIANISYAYGGAKLGDAATCEDCTRCLEQQQPKPGERLTSCPTCHHCSLDCSHFVHLIYQRAGIRMGYLPTQEMLALSARQLLQRYGLIDLGTDVNAALAGDLLVYRGHVVMLETAKGGGYGDIIHATGGKDVRGPGMGIQRERRAPLAVFRGPLLRILRPKALVGGFRRPVPSIRQDSRWQKSVPLPDAG